MPLSGFIFSGGRLIQSFWLQSIRVFKMPLLRFIFDGSCLILSLFPQKYLSFQNTSLRIYIRQQSFNPISSASKISKFPKCLSQNLYSAAVV